MKIKKLHMKNFRGFEDKTVEFADGFNILIGDNGSGKTAVCDAVALVLSGFLKGILDKNIFLAKKKDIRLNKGTVKDYPILIPCYPMEIDYTMGSFENARGEMNGTYIIYEDTNPKKSKEIFGNFKMNEEFIKYSHTIKSVVLRGAILDLPLILYVDTDRSHQRYSKKVISDFTDERLNVFRTSLDFSVDIRDFKTWFMKTEHLSLKRNGEITIFRGVKQGIFNSIADCIDIEYDQEIGDIRIHLRNGDVLPFSNLSAGYRNYIAMVADIAYRCAILNPHLGERAPLETEGIVIIDELDLHLHPKWQRDIVGNLKKAFPKIQFIATTHSPFIIQSMENDWLINLTTDRAFKYSGKSLEDTTYEQQGFDHPEWSNRRKKMFEVGKKYYELLEDSEDANEEEIEKIKDELDELSAPYSDDPAFMAILEMERIAKGLGKLNQHETS